jgi:hypothetical protein
MKKNVKTANAATNKTPLEKFTEASNKAVNVFMATIESLRSTNNAITEERKKNDEMIVKIQTTNTSLDELKNSNEKIIANFEGLLK